MQRAIALLKKPGVGVLVDASLVPVDGVGDVSLTDQQIADAIEQPDVQLGRVRVEAFEKFDVDADGLVELLLGLELRGLLLQLCDLGHQPVGSGRGLGEEEPPKPGFSGWSGLSA